MNTLIIICFISALIIIFAMILSFSTFLVFGKPISKDDIWKVENFLRHRFLYLNPRNKSILSTPIDSDKNVRFISKVPYDLIFSYYITWNDYKTNTVLPWSDLHKKIKSAYQNERVNAMTLKKAYKEKHGREIFD